MISKLRISFISVALLFCVAASAQLNGNYTINSAQPTVGSNFQSFNDFATAINNSGVSGSVTTTVVPGSGPYTEQVTFDSIPGTSASATVTLEGSGETFIAATDSTNRHAIRLKSVKYFTINNLRIERDTNSTSGFYGIQILNTGFFITISNCAVYINGTTSTLAGGYVASGSETSILANGDFGNLSFISDTSVGGGYGVSVVGAFFPLAANINISNNVLYDFHTNGVYLRETDGAIVKGNFLDKRTPNITSVNAIQIAQNSNVNASIYNNEIKVSQQNNGTVTFRGIYLFNGTGHKVYNNIIHDINLTSGNFTGIEVRTTSSAPEIYFNTIAIDNPTSTSGNLYGIKEELSNTNSVLRNNLVSISQPTTGTKSTLVLGALSALTTALSSNYNLLWAPGGNIAMQNTLTPTFYPTLSAWQAASTEDSVSLNLDPMFISATNSEPTNLAANDAGIPIAGITTDALGNVRGVIPDVGAIEFPSGVSVQSPGSFAERVCCPNPFTSVLNIVTNNNVVSEITLYNAISGKTFKKHFSSNTSVDTRELPAGIYFYEIISGNKIYKGKVVKQ